MYYFIVNPKSSSNRGIRRWRLIEAQLNRESMQYKVFFTEHEGHATAIADTICQKHQNPTLVAVGGDGTANEVISGIPCLSDVSFGYIPTGSSNDLARSLGIPSDPLKALDRILYPKSPITMDVGYITNGTKSRSFAVSTGIGYDAAVCHEALHSGIKRILNRFHLGKLTYMGIALRQLLLLKPSPLVLTLDNEKKLCFDHVFFAAVMNQKYEGGGFMFCPEAKSGDGWLDVCVIEKMPKLKVLMLLPTAFRGKHVKYRGVHIYRCKKAQLKTPRPLPVHADGESFDVQTDVMVSLYHEPLLFLN